MGGIAVFASLFIGLFVTDALKEALGWPSLTTASILPIPGTQKSIDYIRLAVAFACVFATGIIDDLVSLKPRQKFLGQLAAAAIAVSSGLTIDIVVNPFTNGALDLSWLGYPITAIYLVAYANIFNLIDGLDGLASGIACIASLTMWVVSTMAGHPDAAALSMLLAGATLGFLRYNFNPASVILGDSGSLLIGFVLGSVSLMSVQRVAGLTSIIVPLVISGIPIIDTLSAIIRRGRAHVSIGQADKGHIHHRLMEEGFNQRETVFFIYLWTLLLCVGSIVMTQVTVGPRIFIFLMLIIASALFAMRLHLFRPVLLHHYNPETGSDEIVNPTDEAFEREAERFDEEHPLF
jgi:UDP-GlcNAc:undecaprenyl-phosphate GlcNAc-1-phosphate transferase